MRDDATSRSADPFGRDARLRLYKTAGLLFALLGLTVAVYVLPVPAAWATPIGLAIATAKAGLVVTVFMELAEGTAMVRIAAAASVVWLLFLFALTLGDYLSRGPLPTP